MNDTATTINVEIGTTEVVDALVHERIKRMEAERDRLVKEHRTACIKAQSVEGGISEGLLGMGRGDTRNAKHPALKVYADMASAADASVYVTPDYPTWLRVTVHIDGTRRDYRTPTGMSGSAEIVVDLTDLHESIKTKIGEHIFLVEQCRVLDTQRRDISNQLGDRSLREKMRGEMLMALVRQSAPTLAMTVDSIINQPLLTMDGQTDD